MCNIRRAILSGDRSCYGEILNIFEEACFHNDFSGITYTKVNWIRFVYFFAIFFKGDNFCDLLFATMHTCPS